MAQSQRIALMTCNQMKYLVGHQALSDGVCSLEGKAGEWASAQGLSPRAFPQQISCLRPELCGRENNTDRLDGTPLVLRDLLTTPAPPKFLLSFPSSSTADLGQRRRSHWPRSFQRKQHSNLMCQSPALWLCPTPLIFQILQQATSFAISYRSLALELKTTGRTGNAGLVQERRSALALIFEGKA